MYVKEFDLFVTAMLLEDTPAVLSLGKLCEDHGYNYHWTSGQKPTFHQQLYSKTVQYGKLGTDRCPWSVDRLLKLSFTYISDNFTAGSRDSRIASRINKK